MNEAIFICNSCHREFPLSRQQVFGETVLCPDCLETETVVCAHCGERVWNWDNAGTAEHPLCHWCYEQDYTRCERCGALLRTEQARYAPDDMEDEYPLCDTCHARTVQSKAIQDYYYKPAPVFFGSGPRFFGVELEVDEGGEINFNAQELLSIANQRDACRLYCKHDGSLNDGFELVSHPMSLDYHTNEMPWQQILRRAVELGYLSHQSGTCGLHIHVSRSAFGETEEAQESAIARVLYFFEKNWEELLKFSRRTQGQLDRWATRYGYRDRPIEILEHAKNSSHANRYTCVNLQNRATIEFRMFRGTLKYNTFLAALQMIDRICDVALFLSDDEVKAMPWSTFVAGCRAPELVRYLKERRLYVNDTVTAEEEI